MESFENRKRTSEASRHNKGGPNLDGFSAKAIREEKEDLVKPGTG